MFLVNTDESLRNQTLEQEVGGAVSEWGWYLFFDGVSSGWGHLSWDPVCPA